MRYDAALSQLIGSASAELEGAIERDAPALAPRALAWMRGLTRTGVAADYFRHPSRFPVVALPSWAVEDVLGLDEPVARDIARSTIAGYWFLRLLDDVVDHEPRARPELLPLAALLHLEFEGGYRAHFAAGSPFWPVYRARWLRSANVMTGVDPNASVEALLDRAAATIGAVVIPLRALTLVARVPERFDPWCAVTEELARIEQILDDLVDWQVDFERGQPNVVVAEGVRRVGREGVPAWVVREGFRAGLALARRRLAALAPAAGRLGSGPLDAFLRSRLTAVDALDADTRDGLASLAALAAAFPERSA